MAQRQKTSGSTLARMYHILADRDGKILDASERALECYGYSRAELLRMSLQDLCAPASRQRMTKWIRGLAERRGELEGEQEAELEHQSRDGRRFMVEASTWVPGKGTAKRRYYVFRDVTEERRIEAAQRESEARLAEARQYRLLTETMKDVVWVIDVQTMRFTYVSPSVERMRGFTAEEVMAAPVGDAMVPETRDYWIGVIHNMIAGFLAGRTPPDQFLTYELEQPCKDGSTVWIEVVTHFHMNAETGHLEIHGVPRDISDRIKAERARRESEAKVKQLEGIIPICMYCKKISDDEKSWHQLERYISAHSEAVFSHGICPDCYENQMREAKAGKKK